MRLFALFLSLVTTGVLVHIGYVESMLSVSKKCSRYFAFTHGSSRRTCIHMSTQSVINVEPLYYTLKANMYESLYVIKNSKFYGKASFVSSADDAVAFVNKHKDVKASHNCWAFRGIDYDRSSDDGEPSGTAGRPILSALQEHDVKNCVVLVTRFFGGVKLGTGGLSRAYQATASQVLSKSIRVPVFQSSILLLTSHVDDFGVLQQLVEYFNNKKIHVSARSTFSVGSDTPTTSVSTSTLDSTPVTVERLAEEYDLDASTVTLKVRVLEEVVGELSTMLTSMTKGRGTVQRS